MDDNAQDDDAADAVPPEDPILKFRRITNHIRRRLQLGNFRLQLGRKLVVRIQRQHPLRCDLIEAEVPLFRVRVELSLHDPDIRAGAFGNLKRLVRALTVDYDNLLNRRNRCHRARDILLLIVSQNQSCNRNHFAGRSPDITIVIQR